MAELWRAVVRTARLMVGQRDYDVYVSRRRRFDPEAQVMSREAFFRYCQEQRYGGKGVRKCPC
ncbi:YbdD/YjiX family protein [Chromobacterium piscinae]|uniref:YbdD/YjiX family protein n=1 Tax=Chromobacterium piscinae TaxID=686831 RepID=A0ABV0H0U5_9NEIS|nr:YbdD/YjiX family protein [Chromobacterium piscinae]MBX9296516.1 YbdD/YjiX family protein [Chromobacterium vaccinii]MBX9346189.1 YbdD/YjiX family protein [Chromobacterium vaccinii]MBX9355296.1 YbdD/YjiX family protein [Chromobacterium vaccinii]MCD4503015.1 YbdD/YjiX family protein [Chromobacterium piscinae]MCD5327582.1 YbdD/YjiX family protein [Chromobacterium piscinae]